MDVEQFIHDVDVRMDRPIHIGKRVASWATGILDSDEYDRWYAILEFDGKEVPVYWNSSIRECSECYIPNLLDFMEKVQAVLIHYWDYQPSAENSDVELYYTSREAFNSRQLVELLNLDISQKGKDNAAQCA